MIAHIDRPTMVLTSALSTVMVGGLSGEHVGTIAMVTGFVTVVVGGLAWLDARVDAKIKKHEDEEVKLHDARNELLVERFRRMLAESKLEN